MIIIVEPGDLPIKVKEWNDAAQRATGEAPVILGEEEFLVSKQVITDSSDVLKMQLIHHANSKQSNEIFTVEDARITAMKIWLEVLHQRVTNGSYSVNVNEIWHLAVRIHLFSYLGTV